MPKPKRIVYHLKLGFTQSSKEMLDKLMTVSSSSSATALINRIIEDKFLNLPKAFKKIESNAGPIELSEEDINKALDKFVEEVKSYIQDEEEREHDEDGNNVDQLPYENKVAWAVTKARKYNVQMPPFLNPSTPPENRIIKEGIYTEPKTREEEEKLYDVKKNPLAFKYVYSSVLKHKIKGQICHVPPHLMQRFLHDPEVIMIENDNDLAKYRREIKQIEQFIAKKKQELLTKFKSIDNPKYIAKIIEWGLD